MLFFVCILYLDTNNNSHKFVRLFPLSPFDLPDENPDATSFSTEQDQDDEYDEVLLNSPLLDFTSDNLITALITDIGVLTSNGVSEELIKMWYD